MQLISQMSDSTSNETNEEVIDWRNGPAKYWYDLIDLPQDCLHYDIGFKLKADSPEDTSRSVYNSNGIDSEDAFHLVSQTEWEKNVIWNGDNVRQKVMKVLEKPSIAGWIPIEDKRKAPEFVKQMKISINNNNISKTSESNIDVNTNCDKNLSTNSRVLRKRKVVNCEEVENNQKEEEVVYKWVSSLPEENKELIYNRWEDNVIWDINAMERIPSPKILSFNENDDSVIPLLSPFISEDTNDSTSIGEPFKTLTNCFNISNDEFYASVGKAENNSSIILYIHHSIPALRLNSLYFPTCVRNYIHFYRPLLRRSKAFPSKTKHNVLLCNKKIKEKEKLLEFESYSLRDLSHFLIKTPKDLTATDGEIILTEYSEEDPPLLMRIGMGSKIISYYKKKNTGDTSPPKKSKYGETKQVFCSPFIGEIPAGQSQLSIETNMFRAPIFEHELPVTDFLVIRTSDSFYIREIDALFVIGQELPLMEVPRPRSKNYYEFIKRFAKIFINRLFASRKSIKNLGSELRKAFPGMSKTMISKCCREYCQRQGDYHVLKGEILTDDQFSAFVKPEECCAYYSAAIAEQKLKESGYGDRLYLISEEKDENNSIDELAIAPWNTTLAYIATLNTKKWLNVTEYNEDASLVYSIKSYKDFKDQMPSIIRCQPVSDLSLKRMNIKRAHQWLIEYGISREKVKKLKNLVECTYLIKKLSEKMIKNGVTALNKTRSTEQHYKFECQKIFDLQTSIFSSKEDFSTDEEEEEDDGCDSELEDMGKDLEAMFMQNKTYEEIDYEREEAERLEFKKTLNGKNSKLLNGKSKESYEGKILKITRTFKRDGKTYTRTEIVRRTEVIEAYDRIRKTKSKEFIERLSLVGNHTENENRISNKSKTSSKTNNNLKVIKTVPNNVKTVPNPVQKLHNNSLEVNNENSVDKNRLNCDHNDISIEENEGLVRVDGFKLKFNKKVIDDAIKIQMEEKRLEMEKKELERNDFEVDYFVTRKSQRVRIDPMVKLKDIFDKTILEARKLDQLRENIDYFMVPVKRKEVPDYYDIIVNPMDLRTIRQNINEGKYSSRREFLEDIELIYSNSEEYNGTEDEMTKDAKILLEFCIKKFAENDKEISHLENEINPILAKDESYHLAFIFDSVINVYKQVPQIKPFFECKFLFNRLHNNKFINLNIIAKRSKEKKYKTIDDFMTDLKTIQQNTTKSFGANHHLSEIATDQILLIAQSTIDQFLNEFKASFPKLLNKNHFAFNNSFNSCTSLDSVSVDENISDNRLPNDSCVQIDLLSDDDEEEESSPLRKKSRISP